jgi:uncharacterized protein YybS (DUF2232 family)
VLKSEGEEKVIVIRDFLTGIAVSSMVFILAAAFPSSASFLFFLGPLPIIFYYSKLGRRLGLFLVLGAFVIVLSALGALGHGEYIPLFCLLGFLGVTVGEVLGRRLSIEQTVLISLGIVIIPILLLIAYSMLRTGNPPWRWAEPYLVRTILENVKLYAEMGVPAEQIDLLRENAPKIAHTFINILPSLSLISLALCIWLNTIAVRAIFHRQGVHFPDFGDLTRWKAPEKLVWLIIGSGGMLLIPEGRVFYTGLNLLLLGLFVYLLQGLAIVSYFFKTRNIPVILRSIFYALLIFQLTLVLPVIAVGLFDLWIDFRKFNKKMDGSTA